MSNIEEICAMLGHDYDEYSFALFLNPCNTCNYISKYFELKDGGYIRTHLRGLVFIYTNRKENCWVSVDKKNTIAADELFNDLAKMFDGREIHLRDCTLADVETYLKSRQEEYTIER